MREEAIVHGLDGWLASVFDTDKLDETCEALAAASRPNPTVDARYEAALPKIKDCDEPLAKYRTALESGTDPAIVGEWIAEVQVERSTLERSLGNTKHGRQLAKDEVRALVASLHNICVRLTRARAGQPRRGESRGVRGSVVIAPG